MNNEYGRFREESYKRERSWFLAIVSIIIFTSILSFLDYKSNELFSSGFKAGSIPWLCLIMIKIYLNMRSFRTKNQ